jgi:MFS family permease
LALGLGNAPGLCLVTAVLRHSELAKVKHSLRLAVAEGMAGMTVVRLGDQYFPPFALALGASTAQIGLLTSIPNLATAASQLEANQVLQKLGSRKRLFVLAALLQAASILPLVYIALRPGEDRIWWLIAVVSAFALFGGLASPAWGGLMSELVPARLRGRYFGRRNALAGLVAAAAALAAGTLLLFMPGKTLLGFAIIFAAGFLCRVISGLLFSRVYEPPATTTNVAAGRGPAPATPPVDRRNLWNFLLFVFAVNFVVSMAGPFFAVYQLKELQYNYLTYSLLSGVYLVTSLVAMARWGRRADRFGNLKAIWAASLVLPVLPFLWALHPGPLYLGLVQALSGFAWAGFTLCLANFVFDAAPGTASFTWFGRLNAALALAVFAGGIVGGFLVGHLPHLFGSQLIALFFLSGLLRLVMVLLLLPRVHEVRRVAFSPAKELAMEVFGVTVLLRSAATTATGALAMAWARLKEPLPEGHPYPAYVVARPPGSRDHLAPVLRARERRLSRKTRRDRRIEAALMEHRLNTLRRLQAAGRPRRNRAPPQR